MDEKYFSILLEVINLFVEKDRRNRFIELLSKPKRYGDGLWDLLHDPRYFDKRVITKIPNTENTHELIYKRLNRLGIQKQCFMISCYSEFDGKLISTSDALKEIEASDSMIYCPKSKIGYYEGHESWRYILQANKEKVS